MTSIPRPPPRRSAGAFIKMAVLAAGIFVGALPSPGPAAETAAIHTLPELAIVARVSSFPLGDVRLLDGPFKHAEDLDAAYLLQLQPDRFLAWFRKEAGLPPKAAGYEGWEARGVAGHSLGHYLSALALMYQSTGDGRLRERVNYIVAELAACQAANGDGYVAAIPHGKQVFAELKQGKITSHGFDLNGGWVPFYTLHKQFAGLRDAYHLAGNAQALEVSRKLADFIEDVLAGLSHDQMQQILRCEHGGMNEVLADLYADLGDGRYLALAQRFYDETVLPPLVHGVDDLANRHANTQIPKLVGLARLFEVTGDPDDAQAAEFFWDRVTGHHSYVNGGNSNGEHFGAPDKLNDRLGPTTTETCNVYNMLKLTEHLFQWSPEARYADYYERALYNQILASQNPVDGRVTYYLSLAMGGPKEYQAPFNAFTCCVGTGMENHAKYGAAIYFHSSESLYVNLFIPSELTWKDKGVTVRQETRFPEENSTRLTVHCAQPSKFALRVRHPFWAGDGFEVRVNDEAVVGGESAPSSYVTLDREWHDGDRVEVQLPQTLRKETMPDNVDRVAFLRGPILLAGELGPAADPAAGRVDYVPVLVTGEQAAQNWLKPAGTRPDAFALAGVGQPRDVELLPLYQIYDQRYTVYWDHFTPTSWDERKAVYQAEAEREKQLAAQTVDFFQPGEMQPERDHNLQGEKTRTGEAHGRRWRDATDGGWFSFDEAVPGDRASTLVITYWGDDAGGRSFDLLVDGRKVAHENLTAKKPDQFYDESYPVPEALTRGKSKVTVRIQADPAMVGGGIFGARVVKTP